MYCVVLHGNCPMKSVHIYWTRSMFTFTSSVDGFGLEAEARMTTWHIMMPSDVEPDVLHSQDVSEGKYLLS